MNSVVRAPVVLDYTNQDGERAERTVVPFDIFYGTRTGEQTEPERWFLTGWEVDRRDGQMLLIAWADIHGWRDA